MFVDLTPEQHALRLKVRDYFQNLMTPELRQQMRGTEGGELFRRTIAQIGRDGWLAVGWPKAYGGQGYGPTEQLIFFEEANIAGAPLPFVTISTVGPALMAHGSALQKDKIPARDRRRGHQLRHRLLRSQCWQRSGGTENHRP